MSLLRRLRRRRGQILIPALLVFPTLFLIIIFLIETVKLSRGKIRNQFGLDISSTLEMEQYSDVLNRLSYLNGVFPDRIFKDVYGPSAGAYWGMGLFPANPNARVISEDTPNWNIRFGPGRAYGNVPDPPQNFGVLHMHLPDGGMTVSLDQANNIAMNYISAYQWMGDVATATKMVFERTTLDKHSLLRKSLYINAGFVDSDATSEGGCSIDTCGDEAAGSFKKIRIRMHYVSGFKHCPVIVSIAGQNYQGEMNGAFNFSGSGLWQLATVPYDDLEMLKRGFEVKQHWLPPMNYFGVDFFEIADPFVHARVTVHGGQVWPDATPKYSSQLLP